MSCGVPGGTSTLYLWLSCEHWGFLEAEFSLVGDFEVLSFTGMNGTTSSGTLPDVVVTAAGCLLAPTLLGSLEVRSGGATSAPESAPSTWGQAKAGYAD